MEVIKGKHTFQMPWADFHRLVSRHSQVVVDLGTGDGRFVYELARDHPDWFCIGIDPARENLEEYSGKIHRKPGKGGLSNALYVIASAEELPPELNGLAQAVYVNFPWGSLLEAVLLAHQNVWAGITRIARPEARVEMLINSNVFRDPIPMRVQELPELTSDYIDQFLAPAYAELGVAIVERRALSGEEMKRLQTTWGKRLAHGGDPGTFYVRAEVAAEKVERDIGHQQPGD